MPPSRRDFVRSAAAMGATLAWGGPAAASKSNRHLGDFIYEVWQYPEEGKTALRPDDL